MSAWLAALAMLLVLCEATAAQVKNPKPPAGMDPGGVAIAILSTGIDYTQADIAARLARDGEGDIIGWDLADTDNRPFNPAHSGTPAEWGGDGTALARLVGRGGRRIVPVRIDPNDPATMGKAASFVARTPARIVAVPMASADEAQWSVFRQAAQAFPDLLFIVPAAGAEPATPDKPLWPAAYDLPNVMAVGMQVQAGSAAALVEASTERAPSPGGSVAVILAADVLAGCFQPLVLAHKGAALKAAILAEAAKRQPATATPTLAACPDMPAR